MGDNGEYNVTTYYGSSWTDPRSLHEITSSPSSGIWVRDPVISYLLSDTETHTLLIKGYQKMLELGYSPEEIAEIFSNCGDELLRVLKEALDK